jgi:glucose/arabinose dehydrogenase
MDIKHVHKLIDELIVPAQREGRIVFTNGGQWVILEGDNVRIVDITGQMEAETVQSAESYAHAWGLTMPLYTRPAEPEASNWLAFELDFV